METVTTISQYREWQSERIRRGERIGFTPTLGALHEGHLRHLDHLQAVCDRRAVSIFVNPTQFGPGEDFERYPRDLERDANLLRKRGCDLLIAPSVEEIYPEGEVTRVKVSGVAERFEGALRPGHFEGVATVVAKLLNIVEPDVMTLGQKDAQQVAVIRRMMTDLRYRCDLLVVPIVRDEDGLALSSRNVYLSSEERRSALTLHRALDNVSRARDRGDSVARSLEKGREELADDIELDYLAIVDSGSFSEVDELEDVGKNTYRELVIIAGRVGKTRLIDNLAVGEAI